MVEPNGKATQYTFDTAGNRLTETITINNSDTITAYSYNNQSRLVSTAETANGDKKITEFRYDNNGSQISKLVSTISGATGSEGWSLKQPGTGTEEEVTFEISVYDVFARLVSVQNDNYIARYKYNADGLRTSKTVTQGETTGSSTYVDYKALADLYGKISYQTMDEFLKATPVELIARAIYGEQTSASNQLAVAWTMVNRVIAQRAGYFTRSQNIKTNLYNIVTHPGAYVALEGEGGNRQSYNSYASSNTG